MLVNRNLMDVYCMFPQNAVALGAPCRPQAGPPKYIEQAERSN